MSFWVDRGHPGRGTIEPSRTAGRWPGPAERSKLALRGLLILLVPLTSMFGLLISAYIMRRHMGDWQPLPLPWQVWLSTLLLVLSSAGFEWARRAAQVGWVDDVRRGLLVAGVLALAFLASQFWAWRELQQAGLAVATNPANSFFFLMTGLHALHLVAGLMAWLRTRAVLAGRQEPAAIQSTVQLCAWYWHFLLAVWLALFGVLVLMA
ncbi:MAG: cytochrome c oxidase subunit 3 [Ectothiorhodospiraceae bacterium]|nr:cytochrome c oxidase subunit 3 [Ectothiorhodospiraceae bacterium]MCH8504274.1 cytochrome c oxidase subunit 3 [Ectothiorhodospiraceae bacterium]